MQSSVARTTVRWTIRQTRSRNANSRNANSVRRLLDTTRQRTSLSSSSSSSSSVSYFSTESSKETQTETQEPDKEHTTSKSLRDSVNRIQEDSNDTNHNKKDSSQENDIFYKIDTLLDTWSSSIGSTWQELVKAGQPKDINKKLHVLHPTEDKDLDSQPPHYYEGSVELMVIDESQNLTAWERMQRRLQESPVISQLLEKGHHAYEQSGAKQAKQKIDHLQEDATEAWETSQNPWVYRASSVYDTLTAESEYAVAVKELRELDPTFTLEEWKVDVVEHTLPQIMKWFLEGRINQLKPWLGEAVHNRLAAEMKARKEEGVQIDTHVLGIMNSEILACEPDTVNKGSPIIVLHFMCQQINCVTKKKDGSVVEGSEDDIRANSYVVAFQREYEEEKAELNWKIVDFRFNGAIAYL
mmetsp:Transcript_26315/g.36930  ORF Transcript_26315/g.36930 Transcript_26315/m.36930 type:complete len:412 (+) Transcript_26315:177-1412(+)